MKAKTMNRDTLSSLSEERQKVKKLGRVASNNTAKPPVKGIAK